MRTASILLALVVVLGFVTEARAANYVLRIGKTRVGISDETVENLLGNANQPASKITVLYLGPFGGHNVPFTATQGLIGFCVIVPTLIALLATFAVRWKKRNRV